VKLLLDTNILIWALANSDELPAVARTALADSSSELYVSVASGWEIAIKVNLGKLSFPLDRLPQLLDETGCVVLPIALDHAIRAAALPKHHADPFDRLLIAQAQIEGLTLVTSDSVIPRYAVPILQEAP
jgi:PIN domain nuclease of toxin-antitoxin system